MNARKRGLLSAIAAVATSRVAIAVSLGVALVVGPLLTFTEATLKGIMDRWLAQCVIVIEKSQRAAEPPLVRLHMFGDMPESLPLTFSANAGLIERISFLNHVEQNSIPSSSNLLVHHLASQRCPGDLCPETTDPGEKMTVRLNTVSPNYVYQFRVLITELSNPDNLKVYVLPRASDKIQCRVEDASIANFFARQIRTTQVFILFLGVVIFTLLLGYLRKPNEASS
ncbi:hypothetical protein LP416_13325 [Polaromonas sp. P2-4]|nr:hypothetical protein LP416_13325 [Polaromonas sp. P2-4]